ncbi:RNA polymerase factor sigma-54 [Dyadobacter frigoris]|uniref:RNA polymerase factor sigma-54 n=1 Tax=Dyadobacter frigoris TaxID=2576211 RepID=A0A4U6D985_9BACT|nr:RNA polymerase factor sigma-54 [Dyadobacter frigoris]TKT93185.1 RNA polymerase factor sigma-54 [Dyadobacter frigoris]GLU54813.1 RNA polymerase sigma-54 factor [Dyadobacter frigoris]
MQRQTQTQRQTLKYSPLQIQMLNLLHLTTMELEQRIKEELEENPILEEGKEDTASEDTADEFQDADDAGSSGEDDYPSVQDYQDWDEFRDDDIPDYKTYANNQSADNELYTRPMVEAIGFRDDLKQQVHFLRLDERQQLVADFILDSLDEDGFLRRESEVIADDISFANSMFIDTEEVEMMLRVIQQLDPPGIAAKDLRECLLIQLHRIENQDEVWGWAHKIVSDTFDELGSRNYDKIMRVLNLDEECLKKAIQLITTLNPKPASGLRNDTLVNESIKPDFMLRYIEDSEIEVQLTWGNSPALRLNKLFTQMAEQKIDKATNQFLKNKMNSAKWFIDAIKQRENTMLSTLRAIVKLQYDYFQTGDIKKLRPMILKDVAEIIDMDISTVSRVTTNKYVQTPFGIVLLKDLFTEGVTNEDGTEVSNREIQEAIREITAAEDKRHPYNDQQITDLLSEKGYSVARRTVAKYREQLNIPTARLRVTI